MARRNSKRLLLIMTLLAALVAASCSTGPSAPEKGTPAFYWQAAKENFALGDYSKTADQLEQVAKTKNEFTERAAPWRLIVLAGLARGHMEIAEQFELGGRANKQNAAPFRKELSIQRAMAQRYSLRFAQAFEEFEKTGPGENITLAFPAPTKGLLNPVPQLNQVAMGRIIGETELANAQTANLQKCLLFVTTRAVGAENDPAKMREIMKGADAGIPKATFFLAMAKSLHEQSDLYDNRRLDIPDRQKFFLQHAKDAAAVAGDSKDAKELTGKIEKALKDMPQR